MSARGESPEDATSQKPPTKPRTRSNYHLENNPFEVSFSQPHPEPANGAFAPPSPRIRPASRDGPDPKPKLPPIAAIASQAGAADFAWAFGSGAHGDVNSLRSGPLSPAMLAGPAQYNSAQPQPANSANAQGSNHHQQPFDVMRTGLTPDVSRTGLTPLIGGPTSFPPPSPNTAAFIAMVTNQNGQNGVPPPATITPGTFSAITGALLNGSNNDGGASTSPNGTHHPHPLSVSHVPNSLDAGDDAAHTAANGLFLLSQAHHELTKREEQQAAAAAAAVRNTNNARSNAGNRRQSTSTAAPAPNKRKNNDNVAPAPAKRARATTQRAAASRGRRKKSEDAPSSIGDDDDDDDEMMDDGTNGNADQGASDDDELEAAARVGTVSHHGGGGGKSNNSGVNKKPETEEEKRKNFLERNRQGSYLSFYPVLAYRALISLSLLVLCLLARSSPHFSTD